MIDRAIGVHLPVSLAADPGGAIIVGGEVAGCDLAIQRHSPDGVFERLVPVVQRGVERRAPGSLELGTGCCLAVREKLLQGHRPDRDLFGARLVGLHAERVLLVSTTTAGPTPGRSLAEWRVFVAVIDAQGRGEGEAIGTEPLMTMAAAPAGDGRVWIVGEA